MKSIVLAGALAAGMLVGTASGFPVFNKRALVTEVVYVTETVADVVVYVDEDGQPYSTTTEVKMSNTPVTTTGLSSLPQVSTLLPPPSPSASVPALVEQPAPSVAASSTEPTSVEAKQTTSDPSTSSIQPTPAPAPTTSAPPPPPPTPPEEPSTASPPPAPTPSKPVETQPAPTTTPPQPSSAAPSVPASKSDDLGSLGLGITYDPYTGSQSSTQCKSPQDIANDFEKMQGYKAARIYGSDCGVIPLAIQNALKLGQKIMGGAYMSHKGNGEDLNKVIQSYKDAIDQYAGGSWDVIQLFSVENERVNDQDMTASEVVDAINRARGQLRSLGYNGPVGAVETVPATTDNPAICQAADVVMVNCHAFFDRNTEAKDAGTFVKSQVERVKSACGGKRVVVTESGWPHQGNANGAAVPSLDNQRLALDSIRANFNNDMFLHHAFDSMWKTDWAASFNAERFWGVIQ